MIEWEIKQTNVAIHKKSLYYTCMFAYSISWYTYVAGSVIGVFVAAARRFFIRYCYEFFFRFVCESYKHRPFSIATPPIHTNKTTHTHTEREQDKERRGHTHILTQSILEFNVFLAVKYANFIINYIYHLMCKYIAVCRRGGCRFAVLSLFLHYTKIIASIWEKKSHNNYCSNSSKRKERAKKNGKSHFIIFTFTCSCVARA